MKKKERRTSYRITTPTGIPYSATFTTTTKPTKEIIEAMNKMVELAYRNCRKIKQ